MLNRPPKCLSWSPRRFYPTIVPISRGDATSSRGDAKSSLGDAKNSLGDAKSSLGDAKSSLGDAKSSLGDAKSSLRVSSASRNNPCNIWQARAMVLESCPPR